MGAFKSKRKQVHQYNENKRNKNPRFHRQTLPHWPHEEDDGPIWRKRNDLETENVITTTNQVGRDEVEEEENYYEVIEEYQPEANAVIAEPAVTSAIYRPQLPLPRSVCCGNRNLTSKTCSVSHSPPQVPRRNKAQRGELIQLEAESTSTVNTNEYASYTSEEISLRHESSETSFDLQWYVDKTNAVREHTSDLDDGSYVIWSDESDGESYVAPDDVMKWTGSREYKDNTTASDNTPWDTSDDNCYVAPNVVLNLDSSQEFETSANEEYELWDHSEKESESVCYVTQDNVMIWAGGKLEADVSTTDTVWCDSSGDCQYVSSNYIINCIGEKVQEVEYSSEALTYLTIPKEYKASPALELNSYCPSRPLLPSKPETEYTSNEKDVLSNGQTIHPYEKATIQFWDSIIVKILVRQILPHMHSCISNSDIDRIREVSLQNNKSAADELLQLIQSSKEPGRWTVFVQALEASGHLSAANILKGNTANHNAHEHEKIIKLVGPQLRERMKPREILVHMRAHDIITDEDVTEILATERTSGYICAADQLLSRIPMKHPDWFNRLLTALVDGGYTDLKHILELKQEDEIKKETVQECLVRSRPSLKQMSLTEDPLAHGHADIDKYDFSSVAGYSTPYNERELQRNYYAYTNKQTLKSNCDNIESQPNGNVNGITAASRQLTCFKTASTCNSRMQHRCPPEFYEMNNEDDSERHKSQILNIKVKSEETTCRCMTLTQSKPIDLKRDNNPNETSDIDQLKQEIERDKEQCEMLDRKIELLREKRAVKSMLDRKKKEVEALKAGDVTYDCYSKYGLGSSLQEMALYTSPNRISGKMTLDYRDSDTYSMSSFSGLWPGLGNFEITPYVPEMDAIQPRRLLDYRHYRDIDLYQCKLAPGRPENNRTRNVLVVDSLYNDSAFYSETNYSTRSQSLYYMV